jgi:thiol-disulfide isomerase/thioredoxin
MSDELDLQQALPEEAPPPRGPRWLGHLKDAAVYLGAGAALWVGVGWMRAPVLPDVAPPLALTALDGAEVDLAKLRGRTVVVNFWATWCPPCRMELPTLTSFAAAHPEVSVLYVAADGTPDALRAFADAHGMPHGSVLIADRATKATWGAATLPTTVVVGPDGAVEAAHTGMVLPPQLWWMTL